MHTPPSLSRYGEREREMRHERERESSPQSRDWSRQKRTKKTLTRRVLGINTARWHQRYMGQCHSNLKWDAHDSSSGVTGGFHARRDRLMSFKRFWWWLFDAYKEPWRSENLRILKFKSLYFPMKEWSGVATAAELRGACHRKKEVVIMFSAVFFSISRQKAGNWQFSSATNNW